MTTKTKRQKTYRVESLTPTKRVKLTERNMSAMRRTLPKGFTVLERRDLLSQPLTPREFAKRPYLQRSRWLIAGIDQHGRERRFYLGTPAELRIGLYDVGTDRPAETLSRPFGTSIDERQFLVDVLAETAKRGPTVRKIGIYADDLRVMRFA